MLLVATNADALLVDPSGAEVNPGRGLADRRPTDIAWDGAAEGRAWCATTTGVLRSDDGGASWAPAGLDGRHVMTVTPDRARPGLVWAGTEPSALYRTDDGGQSWREVEGLHDLPSSPTWAFPPKPQTNHVRWIAPHPREVGRLFVAIEAGALVQLHGGREWRDRVDGGPFDTHELAIHPDQPDTLRVAAGDGWYESDDAGATWRSSEDGLEVTYLRSVAVDPGRPAVLVVSGASGAHSAYAADRSDGRVWRRERGGRWKRVVDGFPAEPSTIAPLLRAGEAPGELWAADERGVHRSADSGRSWQRVARYPRAPAYLRGLSVGG